MTAVTASVFVSASMEDGCAVGSCEVLHEMTKAMSSNTATVNNTFGPERNSLKAVAEHFIPLDLNALEKAGVRLISLGTDRVRKFDTGCNGFDRKC